MDKNEQISVNIQVKNDEQAGYEWIRIMASFLLKKAVTNHTEGSNNYDSNITNSCNNSSSL